MGADRAGTGLHRGERRAPGKSAALSPCGAAVKAYTVLPSDRQNLFTRDCVGKYTIIGRVPVYREAAEWGINRGGAVMSIASGQMFWRRAGGALLKTSFIAFTAIAFICGISKPGIAGVSFSDIATTFGLGNFTLLDTASLGDPTTPGHF